MSNQEIMNQKKMNSLSIKIIRKFFAEPESGYWQDRGTLPSFDEEKLFKSYEIYNSEWQNRLLLLWAHVQGIQLVVNDAATCTNCELALDENWKCCWSCSKAVCNNCYECAECIGGGDDDDPHWDLSQACGRCCHCGTDCGAYICRYCKRFDYD